MLTILGSLDQYMVLMAFYPDDDRAIVLATNVGEEGGGREQIVALSRTVRDAFGL